ncbi:MAG: hypothetical protein L0322_24910 [Chloroflexi bacterium]|nr:hypothetical protein [Chloroflexota bacterium]MCI0647429.1 hypothetical protein [Chloroflexota bacterium]
MAKETAQQTKSTQPPAHQSPAVENGLAGPEAAAAWTPAFSPGELAAGVCQLPANPTTQRLRQARVLTMQHTLGNHFVQRQLVQRQAAGGGTTAEAVNKARAQQARAQKILLAVYGNIRPIVSYNIEVLDDAALKSRYDDMKIRKQHTNPRTGQPWQRGDAAGVFQTLDGFADQELQIIYVLNDKDAGEEARVSLIAHEMLHMNAAPGFAAAVGPDIDEGTTETLTIKACKAAKITAQPAYGSQVDLVQRIGAIVGEGTLEQAYFNGPSILSSTFDAVRGEGMFARLHKYLTEQSDMEKALSVLRAPRSPDWVKEKIKLIEDHLNSWWVSDDDMAQIKTICATATPEELAEIRAAIAPQVTKLSDHGQRAELRLALGV